VQSALFLLSVHGAMLLLERWHMHEYEVALTQTCVAHMLWSQWHTLGRHKHVLIDQGAVRSLAGGLSVLAWGVCALMMPRATVEIVPLAGLMFVGEVLDVGVSLMTAVVLAVGDTVEAGFVDRLS
jgi:predicted ribosome-associated RNA-binding protein Tma20